MTTIGRLGTSHYQTDGGVRSDRAANQAFDRAAESGGTVNASETIRILGQKILDGGKVTDAEKETLAKFKASGMGTPAAIEVVDILLDSTAAIEGWETRRKNLEDAIAKVPKAGEEAAALQKGTASMLQTRIAQQGE